MKRISIVIPSYNGKYLLEKNLPKVLRTFSSNEIIIVDDGSCDGSTSFLRQRFPRVKVLINNKNLGFASTANTGIVAAKSDLVFLLNNDCCPERNFLALILPYFEDSKTFAVGCLEKLDNLQRGRGIGAFRRGLFCHQPGDFNKDDTLWTFGAGTIYNKKIFQKIGGFDEIFNPFYWEDFDLSYRALKSGYKIYFEKKAIIYHQESSTIKKHFSNFYIQKISCRNQLITCWKNITDLRNIVEHIVFLPYHLVFTSLKTKGAFLISFFMALLRLPQALKSRNLAKKLFKLSDKDVLKPFEEEL